jgi:hypothetical protein
MAIYAMLHEIAEARCYARGEHPISSALGWREAHLDAQHLPTAEAILWGWGNPQRAQARRVYRLERISDEELGRRRAARAEQHRLDVQMFEFVSEGDEPEPVVLCLARAVEEHRERTGEFKDLVVPAEIFNGNAAKCAIEIARHPGMGLRALGRAIGSKSIHAVQNATGELEDRHWLEVRAGGYYLVPRNPRAEARP